MENPINYITDNPNNLFEKAKGFVGKKATEFAQSDTGQGILESTPAKKTLSFMDWTTRTYRETVAPNLTGALLAANSNYRAQHEELSLAEQFALGKKLSVKPVDGPNDWRRAISPGRAFFGLAESITPGVQAADKLDWSNAQEVNKFFSSGSAQFFSGAADIGFNFLDPVQYVPGKFLNGIRKTQITRPVGYKFGGRLEGLVAEVDAAVANPQSKSAANNIFSIVEKDPEDITKIMSAPIVANSTNPTQYAAMLSRAYTGGGREKMGQVIKASLGDIETLNKIKSEDDVLHTMLMDNAGQKSVIQRELEDVKSILETKKEYTPEEVTAAKTAKEELLKRMEEVDAKETELAKKRLITEGLLTEDYRPTQTWARSGVVERVRSAVAQAGTDAIIEVDPNKSLSFAKQVAKSAGTATPYARAIMWISPNQQLRETPAGLAFLGGAAGNFSYKEFDARLNTAVRYLGMSKDDARKLSNDYRKLSNKSERNIAFRNLSDESMRLAIQKHYGSKLDNLSFEQQDAINMIVRKLADNTARAQRREINRLLDTNYTVTDINKDMVAHQYLDDFVKQAARDHAMETRGAGAATQADEEFIKRQLRENQLFETQVPYIHFGVDMHFIDKVLSENPKMIGNVVDKIIDEGWDSGDVAKAMDSAADSALLDNGPTTTKDVIALGRKSADHVVDAVDMFYTLVWKPATLLSLKYTSRNLLEGYLRVAASIMDFSAHSGYGWTDMFTGFRNPGAIKSKLEKRGVAKQSTKSLKKHYELQEQVRQQEKLIQKGIGRPKGTGSDIAFLAKENMLKGIDRDAFISNDSVSMTVAATKKNIGFLRDYKSAGDKNAEKIVKILREDVGGALKAQSESYGTPASTEFIKMISEGKYQQANALARTSSPSDLIFALQKYRDEVEVQFAKLEGLNAGSANMLDDILENSRFALSRFLFHTDSTIKLLGDKGTLLNEIADISHAGKTRISVSGTRQIEIYPNVWVDSAFSGEAGEMIRNATSSKVSTTKTLADDRRVTGLGLLTAGSVRTTIKRTSPDWVAAHTEYVNNILMKDALTRHMIESLADGMTPGEAIIDAKNWIATSKDPELANWKRETKYNMSGLGEAMHQKFGYDEQIHLSLVQIETHLPSASMVEGKSYQGLYRSAVDGFTAEDSKRIHFEDRNDVTGNIDKKQDRVLRAYQNGVSRVFTFLGSMPEDTLVRHPFFNMVHDAELKRMVKNYEKNARKAGMSDAEINDFIKANAERFKTGAVNRAYRELMTRLYSVERYTSPAKFLRWVAPFYMAHQNTSRFWIGTTLREPGVAYAMAKAYNAPYRAALVYDENGNLVEQGNPWDPNASREKMQMETPLWLRNLGVKDTIEFSPSGFDVITQGQPFVMPTLGGPVGEVTGRELIKWTAKNTNADQFLQEKLGTSLDEFASKYVLPYYDKTYGESIGSNIVNSATPFNSATISAMAAMYGSTSRLPFGGTLLNGTLDLIPTVRGRWDTRYEAARREVTAQMLMNNESVSEAELQRRAMRIATNSLWFESVLKFGPFVAAGSVSDSRVTQLRQELASYQNGKDGYVDGSIKFVAELENRGYKYGSSIVSALSGSSVENKFGLNANLSTVKGVQANLDAFSTAAYYYQDNRLIGDLFNTGYDKQDYSKAADELMYGIKINGTPLKERNPSPQSVDSIMQIKAGWAEYNTNIKYVDNWFAERGIEPDSDYYKQNYTPWKKYILEEIGKKLPAFATKSQDIMLNRNESYIEIANYFVNNKQFMDTVGKNNDAIAGLKAYMDARAHLMPSLDKQRELSGVNGIDTKANKAFKLWIDKTSQDIIAAHPDFQPLYEQYFKDDKFNAIQNTLEGLN